MIISLILGFKTNFNITMAKSLLRVIGISSSQTQSGAYALIMSEIDSQRRIPIIIGPHEAQSIAIQLENMHPSRPLTHDLFKKFAENFDISVVEVIINKFVEGVFHSVLICKSGTNVVSIDARTSDAVAIALRFDCPIYALDEVIEKTAIELDDSKDDFLEEHDEEEEDATEEDDIFDFTSSDKEVDVDYLNTSFELLNLKLMKMDDLTFFLQILIQEERYEDASKVRDEIESRKKGK